MMPVPTDEMAAEAQRGLDWRAEYGRGGTAVGVARARDIVNKRDLSIDTVQRMASYFARHEVDKQGEGFSPGEDGYPSAGRIAWALWGGDPGQAWAARQLEDLDREVAPMGDRTHERQIGFDADGWEVRAAPDGDGLTIAGYVAKFNERTAISDFLGEYTERIKPGAFARTLAERGPAKVRMQFNHGHDATFGTLPIGVWTSLREDKRGLYGEGRIHDTWHTLPIRAAIESGALDGMSFRFKTISEEWRQGGDGEPDERTLTEVALFEAGPVVNPAYEGTSVGVRARALDLLRDQQRAQNAPDECATLAGDTAVAPVGDTDPTRAEADPPDGITRREMRQQALVRLGVLTP